MNTKAQQKKLIFADIDKIKKVVANTKVQEGSGFFSTILKAAKSVITSPLAGEIKTIVLKEVLIPLIRKKMGGSGYVLAGNGLVVAGGSLKLAGEGCCKRKTRKRKTKK